MNRWEDGEKCVLEGKAAAECGLSTSACPYRDITGDDTPNQDNWWYRAYWHAGWSAARYRSLLIQREKMRSTIVKALREMVAYEKPYSALLSTLRKGLWRNPAGYVRASIIISRIPHEAWSSESCKFLADIYVNVYFPSFREKFPTIAFSDESFNIFKSEDMLRKLIRARGDNGQIADMLSYSPCTNLQELVNEAGGSSSIHVW